MAELTGRVAGSYLSRPTLTTPFTALVLAGPVLLGVSLLLPDSGVGLALRLLAAGACVLLLPGALVQRAIGWPSQLGVAVAGAFAWSLGAVAAALAVTFVAGASLSLTVALVGVVAAVALVPALLRSVPATPRSDRNSVIGLAVVGLGLGAAVWWASGAVEGDGLFHLGRVRKLDELPELSSVASLNEFKDGGLHPGYAFPLWHAALALVARVGAVDPAQVVEFLPALLVPLALVLAYGAGLALFGSWAAGLATAAGQAGIVAFSREGIGSFETLSLPPSAARILIAPALLALVFSFLGDARRRMLVGIAVGGGALAIVHPTYVLYVALGLTGFALARAILVGRAGGPDVARIGASVVAMLVPSAVYFAWLLPIVRQTESFQPDAIERERGLEHYANQLDLFGGDFRLAPDTIARGGVVALVALLTIALLVLVPRQRWTAYVAGASVLMLAVMLAPPLFSELSDAVSLSQSRRLPGFLPLPFAFAGLVMLAGQLRTAGVALMLALGGLLVGLHAANVSWLDDGGTGWAVWIGLAGAVIVLALGRLVRRDDLPLRNAWVAVAAAVLILPVAINGLRQLEQESPDPRALSAGLIEAVRSEVPPASVVFADLETSYRLAAAAPVDVAAAPPAHVADTTRNRPYERRSAVVLFYYRDDVPDRARQRVLRRFDAEWVVVDKARSFPEFVDQLGIPVFEDDQYVLYRVPDSVRG